MKKIKKYICVYVDLEAQENCHTNGSPVSVILEKPHSKEMLVEELKNALSERSNLHGFIPVERIKILNYTEYHCREELRAHLAAVSA